jgi:S1-C subfamily serine protease
LESEVNLYNQVPLDNPIAQISGLLVAGTNESDLIGMGTAFIVAPYLAFTARHVIDEIFQKFEDCLPPLAKGDVHFGLELAHMDPEIGLLKWTVRKYGYSPSIDIAALILEPEKPLPTAFTWRRPQLSLLPPPDGSRLMAFGYPNSRHRVDQAGVAKIAIDPRVSTGTVLETHLEYRDRSMLPFPCLHTDARFDPGMSGGPVFDQRGAVFGLVTSNMPPSSPDDLHSSYVSLLWPALGLDLPVEVSPSREPITPYPLKRLVDDGRIDVLEADLVSIESDGKQNRVTVAWPKRQGTTPPYAG